MKAVCSTPRATVAKQVVRPELNVAAMPQINTWKVPKHGLGIAGMAMLASSVLVMTPLSADAAPTLTFVSPGVKQKMEASESQIFLI